MKPRTVLFYDHTAKMSGGEISLLHLVTHMHTDKYRPLVVLGEDGPLQEKLEAAGIETHILPLDSGIGKVKKDSLGGKGILLKLGTAGHLWTYIWKLSRFIRRHHVALVHTNSLKSDLIGGLAARLARKPVIWHVRDCIDTDYLPGAAVKLFRAACRRIPQHIISISKAVEDTLALPSSHKVTIVHNGVPSTRIPDLVDLDAEAPIIGMVGRITRWKGQHVFLQAAAKVREKVPNARFQIVGAALFGEHEYEAEIQALTRTLKLEDAVEYLGFQSNILDVVNQFTVFVHASISAEPFGKVVIEAMLASKPVVATLGGGIPDIVVDGTTGYLVPMGDADAMAERILELLGNPRLAEEMGIAGRKRVLEHFTIQQTVEGVEAVYDKMLG